MFFKVASYRKRNDRGGKMANKMGPAKNRKYRSLYGFPSGSLGVLETLRAFLRFVDSRTPGQEEVLSWYSSLQPTPTPKTAFHYVHSTMRLGLCERKDQKYSLTTTAKAWLVTENNGLLLSLLTRRFDFVSEILDALAEAPRTVRALFELATSVGYEWREETQISSRLFWLSTIGIVSKAEDLWVLGGSYFGPSMEDYPSSPEDLKDYVLHLSGIGSIERASSKQLVMPNTGKSFQASVANKRSLTSREVETRAIDYVIQDLIAEGFSMTQIHLSSPRMGLDFIVTNDTEERLIEVKGTTDRNPSSVTITQHELLAMRSYEDRMWLYVVSNISDGITLHKYRNPGALDATQITSYRLHLKSAK